MMNGNLKEKSYPRVEINLAKLRENIFNIKKLCSMSNIEFGAVIKGCDGNLDVVETMVKSGIDMFLSSRLRHLIPIKKLWSKSKTMLIRPPMLSEVDKVIEYCDFSINSSIEVLEALDNSARRQGVIHKVILMADLGDLREGFWDKNQLIEVSLRIEKELTSLRLVGLGTNLGCYGCVKNTPEKMTELSIIANDIEKVLNRKLDYISGGGTMALPMVLEDKMPDDINFLRIGEAILLSKDLEKEMPYMNQDVFTLKMEVIEIFDKPTYPVGDLDVDGFGLKNKFVDKGIRRRGLLAGGKVDYGYPTMIFPKKKGIEVVGASSDHTIIDIEDYKDIKIGDILEFTFSYAPLVYSLSSIDVGIDVIDND